MNQQESNVGML